MPLKRYLLICFAATFVMVFLALLLMPRDEPVPVQAVLIFSLVIACINTFVQILPVAAATVPVAQRTSFWAYKWTNALFLGLPAAFFVVGLPVALLG